MGVGTVPAFLVAIAASLAIWAAPASAQNAWVRGEVRLNLRSGPGSEFRILGVVKTGDSLAVLSRDEKWTQVRTQAGKEGWIPGGYLSTEPPPGLQLERLEAEAAGLRTRFEDVEREAAQLRSSQEALSSADEEQRAEIDRLTRENLELRAGARWPEWITGALILSTGMALGALLRSLSGRGQRPRIKL